MAQVQTTDVRDVATAVLDAIEHLENNHPARDDHALDVGLKAAHARLSEADTSDAPREVAAEIQGVVDRLAETPNVEPQEWGVIARESLADLAPIAADVARDREQGTQTLGSSPPMQDVVECRERLQTIDDSQLDTEDKNRVLTALEALDEMLVEASPRELAAIGQGCTRP